MQSTKFLCCSNHPINGRSPAFHLSQVPPHLGSPSHHASGDKNDTGDADLSDAPLKLLDNSGVLVATTPSTDADANYACVFYDVPCGTYALTETTIASIPMH